MRARYWLFALVRGLVAGVFGCLIAFDQDHTAQYGLIMFGVFGVLTAATLVLIAFAAAGVARVIFLVDAAVGLVAGVIAIAVHTDGLALLLYLVSVWATITGVTELYLGLRGRRTRSAAARDWVLAGAITAVLALVFVFIPADTRLAVGLFGAYAVVVGVFVVIGALSLRFAQRAVEHSDENGRPA